MALQAYYDGSGKPQDSAFVTLAGIAAPEEVWSRFDALWVSVLKLHHLEWWHTADAMQGKPKDAPFVEPDYRDEWNYEKALAALADLKALIYNFLAAEHRNGFQVLSCTVNMAGYRAAKAGNPWLRDVEAICVNTCVGSLALHEPGAEILLYFDEGESFRRHLDQVWDRTKKRQGSRWPRQIHGITHATDSDVWALQAADLIAWDQNRIWSRNPYESERVSIFGRTWRYFNQRAIEDVYPPEKEKARTERHRDEGLPQ